MTYAIERFADPADAYMMRATALEQQGNLPQAIRDLEVAAAIAERIGNDALFATARVRMGMLLQVAPALSLTPAP
jgi:tetratricopeptide (TPR) repeat protein